MEDDKKKRRNKKKKVKQTKRIEDAVVDVEERRSADQNHMIDEQNDHVHVSETNQVRNGDVQNTEVDLDRHRPNGTEGSVFAEAEKQILLQREEILRETIRQLQNENDSCIQKEARLEEAIKQLQNEHDSHIRKEAELEETIKQLQNEKDSYMQKQLTLEETIQQLQNENHSYLQKKAKLEMNVVELQSEKDLWLQKESSLELKISQLLNERAALDSQQVSLAKETEDLEREKASWILMENTTKELVATLNDDISQLRVQVMELEQSRNKLTGENQQLIENVYGLKLQLQSREENISAAHLYEHAKHQTSEHEDLNAQIEAASTLVEKLIMENADLVEKVTELYMELNQRTNAVGIPGSAEMVRSAEMDEVAIPISEPREIISVEDQKLESLEVLPIKDERVNDTADLDPPSQILNSSRAEDAGEIVQIPLDENNSRDLELQAVETDEKDAVPLSDAPLIGAPFRLISFVAKYVSGADLVNKN